MAAQPPQHRGEQLVRTLLAAWEQPSVQEHLLGMLRTAASHEAARQAMQQTLHAAVQPAVAGLAEDQPDRRSGLVMSQMAGLLVSRYFLRIPEVVAQSTDELVASVGPCVQR